jgi:uncharacterized protein YbjQ (UPF0145 family)
MGTSLPVDPALVVTTDEIPGYRITQAFGVAEGLGIAMYTGMFPGGQKNVLTETMREAFFDMLTKAASQGANAITGVRYATPSSANERIVLVYGTAVKVQKTS